MDRASDPDFGYYLQGVDMPSEIAKLQRYKPYYELDSR